MTVMLERPTQGSETRRCACGTALSRYNSGALCGACQGRAADAVASSDAGTPAGPSMQVPNLFKVLVAERRWTYRAFCHNFEATARELVDSDGPHMGHLSVAERTFRNWSAGLRDLPTPDACRVLETMLGYPAEALFGPAAQRPAESASAVTAGRAGLKSPNADLVAVMDEVGCSNSYLGSQVAKLAAAGGMDLRTDHVCVKKWREGAMPRPETVPLICQVLTSLAGEPVTPEQIGMTTGRQLAVPGREIVRAYGNRGSVPDGLWAEVIGRAVRHLDVVCADVVALTDAVPGLVETLRVTAQSGALVRLVIPDAAALTGPAAARAAYGEALVSGLAASGVRVLRHFGAVTEVVRADDELLVTASVDGVPAAACPVLHLRRTARQPLAGAYLTGLENTMGAALPVAGMAVAS